MWKDIKGWEDYYEVSDQGKVRNKLTQNLLIGECSPRENTIHSILNGKANYKYKPFIAIFENGQEKQYNTTTDLINDIPKLTKTIILSWFNKGCKSYTKYGIKEIYRL